MKLRTMLVWATLVMALGTVNWLAFGREQIVADGQVMYLALAPVDPRSLLQGDYMDLRYGLADDLRTSNLPTAGLLVVRVNVQYIATFARLYTPGTKLVNNEHMLRYRVRSGTVRIGAESFFFQEGEANGYQNARYAELRVAPDGTTVLVGLRGTALEKLPSK